jgi:methyl-accepting chemotaxis protein
VKVHPETGGDRLVLIDPATNQELGDYTEINQGRAAAIEQARAATEQARAAAEQARAAAEQARAAIEQARAAIERAKAEAEARAQAEAHVRELQDQLRRLKRKKRP